MTGKPPRPPSSPASKEVVARSKQDIEGMSDRELLGADYGDWLKAEKRKAKVTLARGGEARLRAEAAIEKAEASLKKAEGQDG
jgi:hypothetical protein